VNKSLTLSTLFLVIGSALAQSGDEINRPNFVVGDSWTYQQTDLWKNDLKPGTKTIAVKKIKGDQIHFRGTLLDGNKWTYNADLDMNVPYTFKGDKYTNIEYSWPLKAGMSWKNDRQFAAGEAEVTLEETCEVGPLTKVVVPAGEFDTYRIACKGFFTNSLGGQGSHESLNWYAPVVKRYVKLEQRWWVGSRLSDQYKDELTAFHLTQSIAVSQ